MSKSRQKAVKGLRAFTRGIFAWRERLLPHEWICRHLSLPPGKNETESGRVRFETRPYLKEIIDCIHLPGVTDIIFVAPTRMGKTFVLRMWMAISVALDKAAALFIDSTEPKGRGFIRKEFKPLVEHNKALRDCKPYNPHHYSDAMMLFPGAALTVFGANSDAQVSGETVKRIFGNECDKWRGATEEEASIIEQTRHRTESFDDERKHGYSSTPTLETGTIWQEYEKGDQRKYHVPCPQCGNKQELKWENVDWSWHPETKNEDGTWNLEAVSQWVRYKCTSCGERWTQDELRSAVRHPEAEWRPTGQPRPGFRSYQINGLYGPMKVNTMASLVMDFLTARKTGFYVDRQDFWNSRMGLPWKDDVKELSAEKFAAMEGNYTRGTLPDGVKGDVLIIGVDVQTWGLPWLAEVFTWDGMSRTVDHGVTPGGCAATFQDIEEIQKGYLHLARSAYVIVDINFEERAAETREAIYMRQEKGWVAAEGFETMANDLVKLEMANAFIGGKAGGKGGPKFPKLMISLYQFKVDLEKRLTGEIKLWQSYQLELTAGSIEKKEQADFYAQLLDERRVPRKQKRVGKPPYEFKSKSGNNHGWDCKVYALALFYYLSRRRPKKAAKPERKVIAVKH